MPEAIADGKVDVEKLKELLDSDVADTTERFGLFWPGKKRALRAAQEPTTATLKPDFENSKDWDTTKNVFIEGDNLEVLKILQKHYHNKIKMIYIDPPYNTGSDFVYPDNYKEGLQSYLEWTRQVNEEGQKTSTNMESEGRYHSNWLNMLYPRLKLARNLLTDDGVIFISIDDFEFDNLRKICNEIFGENNALTKSASSFIWQRSSSTAGHLANSHEYVLVYAKRKASLPLFRLADFGDDTEIEHSALKRISKSNPASSITFPCGMRFDGETETFSGTIGGSEKVIIEGEMVFCDGKLAQDVTLTAGWAMKDQILSWISGERTYDSKGQLVVEFFFNKKGLLRYRKERGTIHPKTVLANEFGTTKSGSAELERLLGVPNLVEYPKPTSLIEYFLSFATSSDDLVLDFFAGSATTGHSVMAQNAKDFSNRSFICVQLPEPTPDGSEARTSGYMSIPQISRRRLRNAGEAIRVEIGATVSSLDIGFRSYKLADTNFAKWRISSDVAEGELEKHLLGLRESASDDATADDLLTEILLKQGYSLTENISAAEVGGLNVRLVHDSDGDIAVLAYLDEQLKPSLEQLRSLVAKSPARIIVLEDAFHGDDELKTNLAQLCKSKGVELWSA